MPPVPATAALHQVLQLLTRGCHRFERGAKAEAYRQARDTASQAVCELLLNPAEQTDEIVSGIEQDLMAALAGLDVELSSPKLLWTTPACCGAALSTTGP